MGRLKKGIFLGGLLGAAAMWLAATPKGKEFRENHLDPLFHELKVSLKQLEGPTKEMYYALVERAVEEYSAKKELALDIKVGLMKELKKKWKEIKAGMGK